jgi:NAD dependent epimerase/dehydratase family enzyme
LPVPEFALRLAVGEMADVLLNGSRVIPERLMTSGYEFRHPELEAALRHVLGR